MSVTVSTKRRHLSGNLPLPIITDRLIIRSYLPKDLEEYHILLTDQGAMEGKNISPDKTYTELLLGDQLPPYNSDIILGIFLKKSNNNENEEGELIGDGGMDNLRTEGEWPSLNYRFKREHWRKGYATEFGKAFMEFWWNLPHEPIMLKVRPNSVDYQHDGSTVTERVYASVKMENNASQDVLEKLGFEFFDVGMGDEGLTHWRKIFLV